jgi:glutamate racemase
MIADYVTALLRQTGGQPPHRAILGCTHYRLVEPLFRRHLPAFTRLLSQPDIVADSFEDYLARHPRYIGETVNGALPLVMTTGAPAAIDRALERFWPEHPAFERRADAA